MSDFFGFNTVMPGRQGAAKVPGNFEEQQQELDRQVQMYALETGEDFEIYDYGETYDNLGDDLDETRDDLNDETFGDVGAGAAGKFSHLVLFILILIVLDAHLLLRFGRMTNRKASKKGSPSPRMQQLQSGVLSATPPTKAW
ncbi:hypothetical protein BGZ76_006981, partial [Entomortierella beljakovae]